MDSYAFKVISLTDLLAPLADSTVPRAVSRGQIYPACTWSASRHDFGDDGTEGPPLTDDQIRSHWGAQSAGLQEVCAVELTGAVVHPPYGIITIDNYVVGDTLGHVPFHHAGYALVGDMASIPASTRIIDMPNAIHAIAGNYLNYYHWLLDVVPKMHVAPITASLSDGVVLLPQLTMAFQRDTATLLMEGTSPLYVMSQDFAVRAASLLYVPNMTGGGFVPNPGLAIFFDGMKNALQIPAAAPSRRIYLTRRDSQTRVMSNEADVAAMVARYDFDVVELTGMSLREQAALFASASHIVAPHGAGLANIVFCTPGIHFCELMMNSYINSCYRSLAVVRELKYGCIVGPFDADTDTWTAPLDRLEAVLLQMAT